MRLMFGAVYRDVGIPNSAILRHLAEPLRELGERAHVASMPGGLLAHSDAACVWSPPAAAQRSADALVWNGRLDNHEDLEAVHQRHRRYTATDAELAYLHLTKHGSQGFRYLVGDWALSMWSCATDRVLLATDYLGVQPLYYCSESHRTIWSSSLDLLVRYLHRETAFNTEYLVGYITRAVPPNATPFQQIYAVPSGSYVEVARGATPLAVRYYDFGADIVRLRRAEDYKTELRRLFVDAIRVRIKGKEKVWSELSGGLDSTAVTCMADQLTSGGQAHLSTVSYVSHSSPEADDSRFVKRVEAYLGRSGHHLVAEEHVDVRPTPFRFTRPDGPTGVYWRALEMIGTFGSTVLLTGTVGDAIMANFVVNPPELAEWFRCGRFIEFFKRARQMSLASRTTIYGVAVQGLVPLLPVGRQLKLSLRETSQKLGPANVDPAAVMLVPEAHLEFWRAQVAKRMSLVHNAGLDHGKRRLIEALVYAAVKRSAQTPEEMSAVSVTHPYLHRPLVEFVCSVPTHVWCPIGEPRMLMREAFGGFIPQAIRDRFSKSYAEPFFLRRLRERSTDLLRSVSSWYLAESGCIDPAAVARRLEAIRDGSVTQIGNEATIVRLEDWIQCCLTEAARGRSRAGRSDAVVSA
jgi:asparagine synthase (glutamine-hydrolysing)